MVAAAIETFPPTVKARLAVLSFTTKLVPELVRLRLPLAVISPVPPLARVMVRAPLVPVKVRALKVHVLALAFVPKLLSAVTLWVKVPPVILMLPQLAPQPTLPLTVIFCVPARVPFVIVKSLTTAIALVWTVHCPLTPLKVNKLKGLPVPPGVIVWAVVALKSTVPEL